MSLAASLACAVLSACGLSRAVWQRMTSPGCGPQPAALVCFEVSPDAPVVLELPGVELVGGECAAAEGRGTGRVSLAVRDGRGGVQRRIALLRAGTITDVRVAPASAGGGRQANQVTVLERWATCGPSRASDTAAQ